MHACARIPQAVLLEGMRQSAVYERCERGMHARFRHTEQRAWATRTVALSITRDTLAPFETGAIGRHAHGIDDAGTCAVEYIRRDVFVGKSGRVGGQRLRCGCGHV